MVSVTTNFTLDELKHINMFISPAPGQCDICDSAKKKIVDALELGVIAQEAKGIQQESMR
jgi:hypothetical protein